MSQVFSRNTFKTNKPIEESIDNDLIKVNLFLVGNRKVGKTSLIFRYITNVYSEIYMPTMGVDKKKKVIETHGGKKVLVTFWDTREGFLFNLCI